MHLLRAVSCVILAAIVLYLGPTLSLKLAPDSTKKECLDEFIALDPKEEGDACKVWVSDSQKCMDGKQTSGKCTAVVTPYAVTSIIVAVLLVITAVVFMFRSNPMSPGAEKLNADAPK